MREDRTPLFPVEKNMLHVRTAETLLRFIVRSGLRPGQKLPSERTLAAELKVGRNTLREALDTLVGKGLVERIPNRGTFVKREYIEDHLVLELIRVDYNDLLDVKFWLEKLAVTRAVEGADAARLLAVREAARQMCALAERGEYSIHADRAFHDALLEAAGNGSLRQMVDHLIDALDASLIVMNDANRVWLKTVPCHMEMAEAMLRGDLAGALGAHENIRVLDVELLDGIRLAQKEENAYGT